MSNHKYSFRSQADRERDEALRCRYGQIGIPAVAAAKSVETDQPKRVPSQQAIWLTNSDSLPES